MDKSQIIIFAAVIAFAGIRLYQKFSGKGKKTPGNNTGKHSESDFSSSKDDYEPYSKK